MRLPTFLILGAAKSGTTSLYRYLGEHPDVFMSPVQEPSYFAFQGSDLDFKGPGDDWMRGIVATTIEDYLANFDGATSEKAIGETSPPYLYMPHAAAAIRDKLPEAKLIAILRDPVERAYSQFRYMMMCGREPEWDFGEALRLEPRRMDMGWEWGWHYAELGFYGRQLERFYEIFPRDQLRVVLYEDLASDPVATMRQIFEFIGVDPDFRPAVETRHRVTRVPRNRLFFEMLKPDSFVRRTIRSSTSQTFRLKVAKSSIFGRLFRNRTTIDSTTERELRARYTDDIRLLEELINRDLSGWLSSRTS